MAEGSYRGRRRLTPEELALWRSITRTVIPRHGSVGTDDELPVLPPEPLRRSEVAHQAGGLAPHGRPQKPLPTPMAPIEPQLRRRLAKGRAKIDAILDLHGATQADAHRRVIDFITHNQSIGARLVLIVTGKGRNDAPSFAVGALRRNTPHWLSAASLRPLVLSVEEASAIHGGAGALYVRLRRRKEARP